MDYRNQQQGTNPFGQQIFLPQYGGVPGVPVGKEPNDIRPQEFCPSRSPRRSPQHSIFSRPSDRAVFWRQCVGPKRKRQKKKISSPRPTPLGVCERIVYNQKKKRRRDAPRPLSCPPPSSERWKVVYACGLSWYFRVSLFSRAPTERTFLFARAAVVRARPYSERRSFRVVEGRVA